MSIWLLDAGFMGGDRDIKISFRAAVQDIRPKRKSEGGKAGGKGKTIAARIEAEEEELIVHKLSVTVGRELWKELWGPFVAGHKWWWDDESIVEECKALGTKWEGVFVEAVKRL